VDPLRIVTGVVLDDDGAPVPGALVRARVPERGADTRPFPWSTTSQADGSFRLEGFAPSRAYEMNAIAQDFVPESFGFWSGSRCEVRLERGVPVRGIVRLAPGLEPVRGARVEAAFADEDFDVAVAETTTDEGGRFDLTHARAGTYADVTVSIPGWYPEQQRFQFEGAGVEFLDVRIADRVRIHGTVLDASTSRPVPGATVSWGHYAIARTDETGSYSAPSVKRGRAMLQASARGYGTVHRILEDLSQDAEVSFRLDRGALLFGTARAMDGSPVEGAEIMLVLQEEPAVMLEDHTWIPPQENRLSFAVDATYRTSPSGVYASTDAEGRYSIPGLVSWRGRLRCRVRALRPGEGVAFPPAILLERNQERRLDLVLEPVVRVRGVVRSNGSPVPAYVALAEPGPYDRMRTTDLGAFEFVDLPTGRLLLKFLEEGGQEGVARIDRFVGEPGVVELDVDLDEFSRPWQRRRGR